MTRLKSGHRTWTRLALVGVAGVAMYGCAGTDDNGCDDCRIELEQVATIGDESADGMLPGRPNSVLQDGAGRYWINVLGALPVVHDPGGDIVLRPIGRTGGGPGEFSRSAAVRAALPGDSMLVSNVREFRVMAPDLTVARSVRSAQQLLNVTVLEWPGRVLAVSRDRESASGTPTTVVAIYDMTADTVAAVDTLVTTQAPITDPVASASSMRRPGQPSADGDVWISNVNSFRLVRYSPAGEAVDSVVLAPDGFPGGEAHQSIGTPDVPASPHMVGNWVDDEGRLWTLRAVPLADTGDAWAHLGDMQRDGEVRVSALPADYELKRTIIEVIDPATKRVLAEHEFDGFIFGVLPGNRVASFVETAIGAPVITIHRLRLVEG